MKSSFLEITKQLKLPTILPEARLIFLYNALLGSKELPGINAEVGSYWGGSANFISIASSHKTLYVCDSFEGLPKETKEDTHHKQGDFANTNYECVRNVLTTLNNVIVIKGFFPDEILHEKMYLENYSFVHIDVDLYKSTLDCLSFFWNRMVKNGVIVIDDYRWRDCPGVTQAVNEFFLGQEGKIVDSGYGNCMVIK